MNRARVGLVLCALSALWLVSVSLSSRPAKGQAEPPEPVELEAADDDTSLPAIPRGERYHPWLPPLNLAGVSIGTTRDGYLLNGVPLPEDDPTFFIMPRQKARDLHYGSAAITRALVTVAHQVADEFPGSILALGDVAAREGGDIFWSVSHNNGRDADIAFFYEDAAGNDLVPQDFVTVNARGQGTDRRYRFDVERNWALVRALLENADVQIQWMFIYGPLRNKLLAHARAIGEPQELIDRAAEVLGQPSDGAPHNDHLHLRIMCSDADLGEGCRDMGRIPSFVRPPEPVVAARIEVAEDYLDHDDPERRARAAVLLGILEAKGAMPSILALLDDRSPEVRAAAARGLELLAPAPVVREEEEGQGGIGELEARGPQHADEGTGPAVAGAPGETGEEEGSSLEVGTSTPTALAGPGHAWTRELARRLPKEKDPSVIEAWVGVLVRQGERSIVPWLEGWLKRTDVLAAADRREISAGGLRRDTFPGLPPLASRGFPLDRPLPLRLLAVSALEELEALSAIPGMLALLDDTDLEVRDAAAWALGSLTNHPIDADADARAEAFARWYESNLERGRDAWLAEGFRLAGFPVAALNAAAAPTLVKALRGPAPVALNAHRALCRISGSRPPETTCSFEASQAYWERWLRRHRTARSR